MAQFITYYSFKGGVGRTLALANSAWLLANHSMEPARVLVIDFDLAAPGLHRVFKMPSKTQALGVVDYVTEYLGTAAVPDVSKFIHKTPFSKIDIIPAGKMDARYQERLEVINWKAVYEKAHGFLLIDAFKRSINALAQDYDYVLVDSLTGFSDVGGICVRQLADSVVLAFRLNQQNLDGISAVFKSLEDRHDLDITPVITPAWPFLDEAAGAWIKKTEKIFGKRRLHEISFDSGLTFGEKIIARNEKTLTLKPKVLEDYQRLASHLRAQNASDPFTMWRSLVHPSVMGPTEARSDLQLSLLKKRPQKLEYWEILPNVLIFSDEKSRGAGLAQSRLREYVNEQCKRGNKFALLGRAAAIFSQSRDDEKFHAAAMKDLTKALDIDGKFSEALEMRARLYLVQGQTNESIRDLENLYKSLRSGSERRTAIAAELGGIFLRTFDSRSAVSYLSTAIKDGDKSLSSVRAYAQALYLDGDYLSSLAQSRKYGVIYEEDDPLSLLPSQCLAALGKLDEATEELRITRKRLGRSMKLANLAEAYLAVDPTASLTLLRNPKVIIEEQVRGMLIEIAELLLGTAPDKLRIDVSDASSDDPFQRWNTFEVIAMVFAKWRNHLISESVAERIFLILSSHVAGSVRVTLPSRS